MGIKKPKSNYQFAADTVSHGAKTAKARIVPQILLLKYGWPHQEAGLLYPDNERSFRQTINASGYSDRGFKVNIDWDQRHIYIDFNFGHIDDRHGGWRRFIKNGVGTGDITPNPYWTFEEIDTKLMTKLNNLMYVRADAKVENGIEYFRYNEIETYIEPSINKFLYLVKQGVIYVDFDARTGHNHGTKFRIRPSYKTDLYEHHITV